TVERAQGNVLAVAVGHERQLGMGQPHQLFKVALPQRLGSVEVARLEMGDPVRDRMISFGGHASRSLGKDWCGTPQFSRASVGDEIIFCGVLHVWKPFEELLDRGAMGSCLAALSQHLVRM